MASKTRNNCNPMVRASGMNVAPRAKCGICPACKSASSKTKKS
ncbi:hypothetical protein LCGC14_2273600 [marine sediment metagenome]|uniref:Uncharacterized protein n=1 Tax=marine sediment metagenome TaxID=412755 RepID=A0A0F9CW78_9ZZZZ